MSQILFVGKRLVPGNKTFKTVAFRCPQQFTILKPGPAHECHRDNVVISQQDPQSVVKVFVKQDLHW